MVGPAGGSNLRAMLQAKRWSYSRLAVELRRRAERDGVTLPKHESLVTLITRWVNNRQQPDGFYRDLLSRTLGLPESELFDDAPQVADLTAGAEPGCWPAPLTPPRSAHAPSTCSKRRSPTSPAATQAPSARAASLESSAALPVPARNHRGRGG